MKRFKKCKGWERVGKSLYCAAAPVSKTRHPIYPTRLRVGHVNSKARQHSLTGFPFRVGGELLSHAFAQYHRRGGA